MFEVDIRREFSAAHCLRGYRGNCSRLHGHNWEVQAFVRAEELDAIGIAVDFRRLKDELEKILAEFDHTNISELSYFAASNPTSELIAKTIFEKLAAALDDGRVKVDRVRVCESPSSGATYFGAQKRS
ncbi:MAG: 6-carboxytetrahydropterin synthase QueD [Victivallales bacterium]|nr:6-carboxytetrahydropterin synthase QueD [Victivallales bacterium]